tara:strand:+ start:258 stop:509 length:252 start_codon:yes stop_codon:yes gene_type:complete
MSLDSYIDLRLKEIHEKENPPLKTPTTYTFSVVENGESHTFMETFYWTMDVFAERALWSDDELIEIKKGDEVIYTKEQGWITS